MCFKEKRMVYALTGFLLLSVWVVAMPQNTRPVFERENPASYFDSMGMACLHQGKYEQAVQIFQKAGVLKKAEGDSLGMILTYENLSYACHLLKQYKKAIYYQVKASELNNETVNPYFQKVIKLFPKADDSLNLTRLYYRFGQFLSRKGRQKQGVVYFREALRLAKSMHYDKAIATISNELAGEYWDLGEKRLSTLYYKVSLAAAKRLNDSNRIAGVYLNLGDNYRDQGELEAGMNELLKALKIKEVIADSSHLSFYYIKAAEIAKDALNWKKWEWYIRKAYAVKDLDHCATPIEKAIIYENLGGIAAHNQQVKLAFRYYDTLMDISRRINYINGIKVALNRRAALYKRMGEPQKALELLQAADKYLTENPYYRLSGNNSKAELYMETGNDLRALKLLEENIRSPYFKNYALQKLQTLQLLYRVNAKLKRYKTALLWNDSLRIFEKHLRDQDVRKKIAELETKYESEKNRRLIGMLKAKNEIYDQQIRFGILLIFGLVLVIAFVVILARTAKLKAEFRENMLRQQLLRSQMNPHFIFNALASIQELIRQKKTREASFYLSKFASIARLVLEYSREESIPLDRELDVLQSYIELEKLRSGNRFDYQIHLSEDLETEFIRIPPMAIQPFVENAIKHGLREKEGKGLLQLTFEDLGDQLKVVIEDDGIGLNQSRKQARRHHRSMAMEIFEKRRALMQKRYKKKLIIRFEDLKEKEGKPGTRVIIHLPVI
jgi:tetratricopeptide (TPR) repeat protein